jgi:uncharacterized protein
MIFGYAGAMITNDPILIRFREALKELYGDRIERMVLYGSRARGDAREDSDYDIALFLKGETRMWDEHKLIHPIEWAIFEETGAAVRTFAFPAESWAQRTLLMHEIRKDGLDL